ncbi:type IV pilus modification protein PilV [Arenimonas sp. MALMAid1274]|uniref:type IV pilus modification protein PilV n=1 Tax=Arenimonas sp. MALMAid1274 TaxID=3411630 RepID=UPI003B9F781A
MNRRSRHRGATLLEVLIAVLILAIGMLGVAAMQATSLRNSQGSLERSQAVVQSYAILDAMRSNVLVARANGYNLPVTCVAPAAAGSLVNFDQNAWITSLQTTMGASACGGIACAANVCEITVRWNDTRSTGGIDAQELKTRSRI